MNAGLVRCLDVQHCNYRDHDHDRDRQIDHNCSTRTSRKFSFLLAFESIIVRTEASLGLMIVEERLQLASGSVPRLKVGVFGGFVGTTSDQRSRPLIADSSAAVERVAFRFLASSLTARDPIGGEMRRRQQGKPQRLVRWF